MNIIAVIEGNIRSLLNLRTPIMEYREKNYCRKCPISHVNGVYTGVCKSNNGGCNCKTRAKTSQMVSSCPKGFWGGMDFDKDKFNSYREERGFNL